MIRASKGMIRAGEDAITADLNYFWNAKVLSIMNLNSMVFIQEIIYLNKRCGICKKS